MIARAVAAAMLALAAPAWAGPDPLPLDAATVLIPGGFEPGRQPDGNSVILEGPEGLVVFDTGRHAAHSDAIRAEAARRGKPIVAIVNSHWHLDHVSGNLRLDGPGVRVFASSAIDGALAGFLSNGAEQGRKAIASGQVSGTLADDVRGDIATFEAGARLRPDVVIDRSQTLTLAGRPLVVNLARNAATAGDVWLYDAQARRAIVGDLVTTAIPFLDTACPEGWVDALQQVAETGFETLVPGHGPVLSRAEFDLWRMAFENFVDCTAGDLRPMETCIGGWMAQARAFIPEAERPRVLSLAGYYGEAIRAGKLAQYCAA